MKFILVSNPREHASFPDFLRLTSAKHPDAHFIIMGDLVRIMPPPGEPQTCSVAEDLFKGKLIKEVNSVMANMQAAKKGKIQAASSIPDLEQMFTPIGSKYDLTKRNAMARYQNAMSEWVDAVPEGVRLLVVSGSMDFPMLVELNSRLPHNYSKIFNAADSVFDIDGVKIGGIGGSTIRGNSFGGKIQTLGPMELPKNEYYRMLKRLDGVDVLVACTSPEVCPTMARWIAHKTSSKLKLLICCSPYDHSKLGESTSPSQATEILDHHGKCILKVQTFMSGGSDSYVVVDLVKGKLNSVSLPLDFHQWSRKSAGKHGVAFVNSQSPSSPKKKKNKSGHSEGTLESTSSPKRKGASGRIEASASTHSSTSAVGSASSGHSNAVEASKGRSSTARLGDSHSKPIGLVPRSRSGESMDSSMHEFNDDNDDDRDGDDDDDGDDDADDDGDDDGGGGMFVTNFSNGQLVSTTRPGEAFPPPLPLGNKLATPLTSQTILVTDKMIRDAKASGTTPHDSGGGEASPTSPRSLAPSRFSVTAPLGSKAVLSLTNASFNNTVCPSRPSDDNDKDSETYAFIGSNSGKSSRKRGKTKEKRKKKKEIKTPRANKKHGVEMDDESGSSESHGYGRKKAVKGGESIGRKRGGKTRPSDGGQSSFGVMSDKDRKRTLGRLKMRSASSVRKEEENSSSPFPGIRHHDLMDSPSQKRMDGSSPVTTDERDRSLTPTAEEHHLHHQQPTEEELLRIREQEALQRAHAAKEKARIRLEEEARAKKEEEERECKRVETAIFDEFEKMMRGDGAQGPTTTDPMDEFTHATPGIMFSALDMMGEEKSMESFLNIIEDTTAPSEMGEGERDESTGEMEVERNSLGNRCYPHTRLKQRPLPEDVKDRFIYEYLSDVDMESLFGYSFDAFEALSSWKKSQLRRKVGLM